MYITRIYLFYIVFEILSIYHSDNGKFAESFSEFNAKKYERPENEPRSKYSSLIAL